MQPLILLAVLGVGAVTMSMGFLMPEIPQFNLQGVAINEANFSTPITTANVDIEVGKTEIETVRVIQVQTANPTTPGAFVDSSVSKTVFLNVIDACSFHTPSSGLGDGSTIICKLTDADGDVVAEGRLNLDLGLKASSITFIEIKQTAFPFANEIQNIDDIKIIVQGTDPTCGGTGQPVCE